MCCIGNRRGVCREELEGIKNLQELEPDSVRVGTAAARPRSTQLGCRRMCSRLASGSWRNRHRSFEFRTALLHRSPGHRRRGRAAVRAGYGRARVIRPVRNNAPRWRCWSSAPRSCSATPEPHRTVLGWLTERTGDNARLVVMRAWADAAGGPPRARPHPDPQGAGWRNARAAPTHRGGRLAAGDLDRDGRGRTDRCPPRPAHRALHTALARAEPLDAVRPFTQAGPNVGELPAGTSPAARGWTGAMVMVIAAAVVATTVALRRSPRFGGIGVAARARRGPQNAGRARPASCGAARGRPTRSPSVRGIAGSARRRGTGPDRAGVVINR